LASIVKKNTNKHYTKEFGKLIPDNTTHENCTLTTPKCQGIAAKSDILTLRFPGFAENGAALDAAG
jgi:hypothetical protein